MFAGPFLLATPVAAASSRTVASFAGVCSFAPAPGTTPLQATFSPPPGVTATGLGPIAISISGSGPCADNAGTSTITLNLSGTANLTCEGGLGSAGGSALWSTGVPAAQSSLMASIIGGPYTMQLVITDVNFAAVADLAWSTPSAIASCPLTGTTATSLSGTLTFESG